MATARDTLLDRLELSELLSRYFRVIDDKALDLAAIQATFLEHGRVVRPNGSALCGWQAILEGQRASFARFRATHHVTADHVADIAGDTATLRANVTAMHLWGYEHCDPNTLDSHFVAGVVLTARAERTPEGWRLRELAGRNVWRAGAGLGMMAADGRAAARQ